MRIVVTESARNHGLDSRQILHAISHAHIQERGYRTRIRGNGTVHLWVGPTEAGSVIEVLAEERDEGVLVVFHAMRVTQQRVAQLDRERRERWRR